MRFGNDFVPRIDIRNRNQADKAAITAANPRPGNSLTKWIFCRTATGSMLKTAPSGKTE